MTKSREPRGDPARSPRDQPRPDSSDDEPITFAEAVDEDASVDIELTEGDFIEVPVRNADRRIQEKSKPKLRRWKSPPKQLVLIGAGKTHLQIINWWPKHRIPRTELTLVSAFDQAVLSSMLPGALAQIYEPDEMLIDLPSLCSRCGVRLIVDRANSFNPQTQEIEFAHQPMLKFDLASINIGAVPSQEELWQSHRILISTKPLSTFLSRFQVRFRELVEQWNEAPGDETMQVVVVGGGADSVELAFALEQRRFDMELPIDVRIVDERSEILEGFPSATVRKVKKLFRKRGIETNLGSRVVDCDDLGPASLILENGKRIRADLVVWVTDAAPPMAVRGFQLPKSPRGFLSIRPTLQSTAEVPVFVVGDIAERPDNPLLSSDGNTALQASVLLQNLSRWFTDQPLAVYKPKPSSVSLISCGDGTAIFSYGGICLRGKWVWWLKDRFDRSWVKRLQVQ